jgi:hypothetical protein
MRCLVRILIHDHLYSELHRLTDHAGFSREFVDGRDGKRKHLPKGTYTRDVSTAETALLLATGAALQVDVNAQVVVLCDNEILSHGCRDVESDPFESLAALLANPADVPPLSLFDFIPEPQKGSPLGSVPSSATRVAEILGVLK